MYPPPQIFFGQKVLRQLPEQAKYSVVKEAQAPKHLRICGSSRPVRLEQCVWETKQPCRNLILQSVYWFCLFNFKLLCLCFLNKSGQALAFLFSCIYGLSQLPYFLECLSSLLLQSTNQNTSIRSTVTKASVTSMETLQEGWSAEAEFSILFLHKVSEVPNSAIQVV